MPQRRTSHAGDLTGLVKEIEALFQKRFGRKAAIAVAFTLEPTYKERHWATNLTRNDGAQLFAETSRKMLAQTN